MNYSEKSRSELWNIIKENNLCGTQTLSEESNVPPSQVDVWTKSWKNSKKSEMAEFLTKKGHNDECVTSTLDESTDYYKSNNSLNKNFVKNEVNRRSTKKISITRPNRLISHIQSGTKFGTKWYAQTRRKTRNEEGPQFYSHKNGEKCKNKLYVALEIKINRKSTNVYGSYPDLDYFLDKIYPNITSRQRCFYEQIKENYSVYEYYDLDLKYGSNGMKYDNDKLFDLFCHERQLFGVWMSDYACHTLFEIENLRVLHASIDGVKTSLHIIHRSVSFRDTNTHKKFVSLFLTYLKEKNSPLFYIIDKGVYTKNRNFRIIGSTKIGQKRPLLRYEKHIPSSQAQQKEFFVCVYPGEKKVPIIKEIILDLPQEADPINKTIRSYEPVKRDRINVFQSTSFHHKDENDSLFELQSNSAPVVKILLEHLKFERCDNYDDWVKICFILKHHFQPENEEGSSSNTEGFNLFCIWSSGSEKYNEEDCNRLWDRANSSHFKTPVTIRSLFHMVKEDDPTWYAEYQNSRRLKDIKSVCPDTKLSGAELDNFTEIRNERYLSTLPKDGNLLIKSYLGTGKTFQIKKLLEKCGSKVLVLSPRRLYASEIAEKLKIKCYLDMSFDDLQSTSKFVISMESLWKINETCYDLVIVDEIESCLTQFHSFETMETNIHDNLRAFEKIIKNAKRVVWSDAFLSQRTIQVALKLDLKFTYIINNYRPEKRNAVHILMRPDDNPKSKKKHLDPLYNKIIELLKRKKKIFFVSASKEKLLEGLLYITKEIPNLEYKYYCSGHSENLKNVNESWKASQLVATTTAITVGIDYCSTEHPFDILCAYFVGSGPLIRDLFQTLMRPRNITGDEGGSRSNLSNKGRISLYYSLNEFSISGSLLTRKEIEEALNYRQSSFEKELKLLLPSSTYDIDFWKRTPWVEENFIGNELEKNLNRSNYELFVNKYLEYCGYNLIENEESDEFDLDREIESVPKKLYEEIKDVEKGELKSLMNLIERGKGNDNERSMLNKYLFNLKIGVHQDKENIGNLYNRIYTASDLSLKNQLNNLRWYKDRDILLDNEYLNEIKGKELVNENKILQLSSMVKILNDLNISDLFEKGITLEKKIIDSFDGQKLKDLSHFVFGYRDRSNSACENTSDKVRYLKGIICKWVGGKLVKERIRKMKRGERCELDPIWKYTPDSDISNVWPISGFKKKQSRKGVF
ncbi:PriCT-2 domain-containing protein [bacterium]|nr:PriCT-2 domain-containing protein [bacterium]